MNTLVIDPISQRSAPGSAVPAMVPNPAISSRFPARVATPTAGIFRSTRSKGETFTRAIMTVPPSADEAVARKEL